MPLRQVTAYSKIQIPSVIEQNPEAKNEFKNRLEDFKQQYLTNCKRLESDTAKIADRYSIVPVTSESAEKIIPTKEDAITAPQLPREDCTAPVLETTSTRNIRIQIGVFSVRINLNVNSSTESSSSPITNSLKKITNGILKGNTEACDKALTFFKNAKDGAERYYQVLISSRNILDEDNPSLQEDAKEIIDRSKGTIEQVNFLRNSAITAFVFNETDLANEKKQHLLKVIDAATHALAYFTAVTNDPDLSEKKATHTPEILSRKLSICLLAATILGTIVSLNKIREGTFQNAHGISLAAFATLLIGNEARHSFKRNQESNERIGLVNLVKTTRFNLENALSS